MNKKTIRRRTFLAIAGGAAAAVVGAGKSVAGANWRVTRIPVDIKNPSALAAAPDGALYVAGHNVIAKFDARGNEMRRWQVGGRPGCLVVMADGRLAAGMRGRIEVFEDAARVAEWRDLGDRAWLTSLAADDANVYVADAGNRAVWRFDTGGELLNSIGEKDPARGIDGFVVPSPYFDVAINPIGEVWVANPGKHALDNYRPNGDLISSWQRPGTAPDAFIGCCNPSHIAFRADSSLVTYEKGIDRIKLIGPDTRLIDVISAAPDSACINGVTPGCNTEPPVADLAVDAGNRIVALDRRDKAMLIYDAAPAAA